MGTRTRTRMITRSGLRQQGFTLVELMVSLVVGMMVVAALFAGFYAISVSNRHTRALTQMAEDAGTALGILRMHVAQSGYSRPVGTNGGVFVRAYSGRAVYGCDGEFNNLGVAIDALSCKSTTGDDTLTDSLAVAYEADSSNSIASGGTPLDCIGNTLSLSGTTNTYYLNYSRFYIASGVGSRNALHCRGPGSATPQALVENVQDMQVLYGVSNDLKAAPAHVAYYAKASTAAAKMSNVVAVRICVLVTSADEVMDEVTDYYNCQDSKVTPADKRMYRAFRSTVLLHNRLGAV